MENTDIKTETKTETKRGITRWLVQMIFSLVIFAAILFGTAGKFDWMQGWTLFGINLVSSIISGIVLIKKNPKILGERSKAPKGHKSWDSFLAPAVAIIGTIGILVVAGLDERFGWSLYDNSALWYFGIIVAFCSQLFALWAMASNPFFTTTVRIQEDRGHEVISKGPYGIVRHPGYLGALFYNLSSAVVLCSIWTLVPAALTVILLFVRTGLEDNMLKIELQGYKEYAGKVRYRIIPGLW